MTNPKPIKSLAERLDQAWEDYNSPSISKNKRKKARRFLISLLDIEDILLDIKKHQPNPEQLERDVLEKLMKDREKNKASNPNYIPILATGIYRFTPSLHTQSQQANPTELKEACANKLLLDNQGKQKDEEYSTTYLTAQSRAEFNLDISKGKLHKKGSLYDSSSLLSHGKKGFVSFTLNTAGELSVFEHLYAAKTIDDLIFFHSSMNAGEAVLAAGEMQIKKGMLVCITTHSGHYQPSAYNIFRLLVYLDDRKVDLSKVKIYLRNEFRIDNMKSKPVQLAEGEDPWQEISANCFLVYMKEYSTITNRAMDYCISQTKTFIKENSNIFTRNHKIISRALEFLETMIYLKKHSKYSLSEWVVRNTLEVLELTISRFLQELPDNKTYAKQSGKLKLTFETMFSTIHKEYEDIKEKTDALKARGWEETSLPIIDNWKSNF